RVPESTAQVDNLTTVGRSRMTRGRKPPLEVHLGTHVARRGPPVSSYRPEVAGGGRHPAPRHPLPLAVVAGFAPGPFPGDAATAPAPDAFARASCRVPVTLSCSMVPSIPSGARNRPS